MADRRRHGSHHHGHQRAGSRGPEPPGPGGRAAILGATDGTFFVGPGGETFISAISLVGTITFRFFMAAMRRPDLAVDPRFATAGARRANLEALKGVVQSWIWSFPDMATLDAQFDEAKIAIGEVRSLDEIAESEWAEYWSATHEVSDPNGGSFRLPGWPWKFSSGELTSPGEPALQGEHNSDVCRELGLSESEIETMEQSGALLGNFASMMIASVLASVAASSAEAGVAAAEDSEPDQA